MPNFVRITDFINNDDNITIIENKQFIIIRYKKSDLLALKSMGILTKNGIYILYDKNKAYVGQNSSEKGIIDRLEEHSKKKIWWTDGLAFIPKQIFTKAHYDYIEKTFILRFRQHKTPLDNKNGGNSSPITVDEINQAETFMSSVLLVLDKLFNINIFKICKNQYVKNLEELIEKLLDNTLEEEN